MKTSKRILATIVAFVLVATSLTVPAFGAFTDLPEEANSYTAVNVLNMLGIINGYDDGSFKPENNVTRAEFTAMLLRTRGMGNIGSTSLENPPFPDVTTPDVSWAIGNIRTAREMGIINGYDDGTFKPNNNVSYEEAVKMIVCALGYGEMGSEGAFWYSKYLMTATSLGFLEGAGGAVATPATREVIALMLYNCLEVNLAEDNTITNKTILENDLKLTKNEGYISANPTISLTAPEPNLREDEIQIIIAGTSTPVTYKVDDVAKYSDMLGAQITFYYTEDRVSGYKTIISATINNTDVLELPVELLVDCTSSTIEYYKNADSDRKSTARIGQDSVVIYNDKLFGTSTLDSSFADYYASKSSDAIPSIGGIKLMDRNSDNVYDVVFVESYDTWIASAVTSANETITDDVLRKNLTPAEQKKLELKKDSNVKLYDANGKEIAFSAIKKGSVLSVKENAHGEKYVIVTNNTVSGKITATNSKEGYTIGDKTYKTSRQAPWSIDPKDSTALSAPQFGDSGKFYLDIDGNIIAYDKTEVVATVYYGYITDGGVTKEDGFNKKLQLDISTKTNPTGKIYTITTKTKINNQAYDDLDLAYDALGRFKQAIKFTSANGNELQEVYTADDQTSGKEIESDKFYLYKNIEKGIDKNSIWKFDTSSRELVLYTDGEETNTRLYIGSSQILSAVDGKYKNMSINDFSTIPEYTIEAFDVTTADTAKYVVVYSGATAVKEVKSTSPVMVITEIIPELKDGEARTYISGYIGKTKKDRLELSILDSETVANASTLKAGDVVRLGQDDEDYYTIKDDHIIFRTAENWRDTAINQPITKADGSTEASTSYPKREVDVDNNPRYKVIWGSAYQYDADRFKIAYELLTGEESEDYVIDTLSLNKSSFSNAKVFLYDENLTTDEKFVEESGDAFEVLGGLAFYGQGSKPTEVFIHMTNDVTVATVIIVNRATASASIE